MDAWIYRCRICHRELTDQDSIDRGIGLCCYTKKVDEAVRLAEDRGYCHGYANGLTDMDEVLRDKIERETDARLKAEQDRLTASAINKRLTEVGRATRGAIAEYECLVKNIQAIREKYDENVLHRKYQLADEALSRAREQAESIVAQARQEKKEWREQQQYLLGHCQITGKGVRE